LCKRQKKGSSEWVLCAETTARLKTPSANVKFPDAKAKLLNAAIQLG
jgi:hypothetical protein